LLLIAGYKDSSLAWKVLSSLFILSMVTFVMISRVAITGCHTWLQVVVGSFIGYLMGLIYYYIITKFDPKLVEEISDNWNYFIIFGPPVLYILVIIFLMI
jgi:membrane-associated phospholipid phosphatase